MLRVSLWVLALICFVTSADADDELQRPTLKGVQAVRVVIEDIGSDAERAGLAGSTLTTDVELRLRQAGITVSPKNQSSPYLYVNVNFLASSPPAVVLYAYSVRVEFYQSVKLTRDPAITTSAVTWNATPAIGLGGHQVRVYEGVRQAVRDSVDQFINAYLAVNPKR